MKTATKLNQLEQIKKFTTVVADTADFESIREFKPQDATPNPSFVYAATPNENYTHFLDSVLANLPSPAHRRAAPLRAGGRSRRARDRARVDRPGD